MDWIDKITKAQVQFGKIVAQVEAALRSGEADPSLDAIILNDSLEIDVIGYLTQIHVLANKLVSNKTHNSKIRKELDELERAFYSDIRFKHNPKFSQGYDPIPYYKLLLRTLVTLKQATHPILDDVFPAPRTFTAQGLKFSNNQEFPVSDVDAQDVVRGVARAKKVFRDRGLLDLFFDSLVQVELSGSDQGNALGMYYSWDRKIELMVRKIARSNLPPTWGDDTILYVFVHEISHHIHMHYMTKEAQDFWNDPWTKELTPKSEKLKSQLAEPHTTYESRSKWMRLILQEGVAGAGKKLKGVERQMFKGWLMAANIIKKLPKQTRLEDSEKATFLENLHLNYVGDLSDDDFKKYLKSLSQTLDTDRPLLTILAGFPLYKILVGSLGTTRTDAVKLPPAVVNLLEIPTLPPDPVLQAEVERLFNLHRTTYDIPSDYAMTNHLEDFAESFTDYLLNPGRVNAEGKWRIQRALWLSGYGGKPVAERLASRKGRAKARPQRHV